MTDGTDGTDGTDASVSRFSFLVQGAALQAARDAVSDAAASARAGHAASGRSPRDTRLQRPQFLDAQ